LTVSPAVETAERQQLPDLLEQHRWHIDPVAEAYGVVPNTVYARIKRHGVVIPNTYRRRDDLPDGGSQDVPTADSRGHASLSDPRRFIDESR